MNKAELYRKVTAYFKESMPHPQTELQYKTPFQLLVAVILSAQCTDKRINLVTPGLFRDYPTAEAFSLATPDVIFEYVKSVSYPKSKSTHLVAMSKLLVEKFGGEVPSAMNDLLSLPGVGRKTANVVRSVVFGKAAMAVDTHVFRVSHRLGLVPSTAKTPESVEKHLMKGFAEEDIPDAHHWLILHGRYVCKSRKPLCAECGLSSVCKSFSKFYSLVTPPSET